MCECKREEEQESERERERQSGSERVVFVYMTSRQYLHTQLHCKFFYARQQQQQHCQWWEEGEEATENNDSARIQAQVKKSRLSVCYAKDAATEKLLEKC